jgi:hypothetical protein
MGDDIDLTALHCLEEAHEIVRLLDRATEAEAVNLIYLALRKAHSTAKCETLKKAISVLDNRSDYLTNLGAGHEKN